MLAGTTEPDMGTEDGRVPACCVHLLKFASLPEFPDDTPDFSDVVGGFAHRRCRARVTSPDGGRIRAPMCAEDAAEMGDSGLFDEDGYMVSLCRRHADLLIARAVEGRACTGALCGGTGGQSDACVEVSVAQPRCGRTLVGSRLYCRSCVQVREETGKTPAKPLRAVLASSATPPRSGSVVSPLTEAEDGSRSDRVLDSVFGLVGATVGAAIGAEQGTAVERTKALDVPPTVDEMSAMDDTTVVGPPAGSEGRGGEDAAGRGDEFNKILDLLGGMSSRLGELERRENGLAAELSLAFDEKLAVALASVGPDAASVDAYFYTARLL